MELSLMMAVTGIVIYLGGIALALYLAALVIRALRKYLREDQNRAGGKEV